MYGGGQFELGLGRGQIQYLASIFHPDGPNDVAPGGYNDAEPPAGAADEPAAGGGERDGLSLGVGGLRRRPRVARASVSAGRARAGPRRRGAQYGRWPTCAA